MAVVDRMERKYEIGGKRWQFQRERKLGDAEIGGGD
jgi:hypothetical protein